MRPECGGNSLSPLRVAAVSYVNTLPLIWGLTQRKQFRPLDLDFCLPAECADRLEAGIADVGLVPCAELERLGLSYLPEVGIACRGPVRSILLISQVAPAKIRSLAVDSSSRTSVALTRIVLAQTYGVVPELLVQPPKLASMLQSADAALVIGDPALRLDPSTLPFQVLDLGAEWLNLTDLPMVFAVWAGAPGVITSEVAALFGRSLDFGLAHLPEIVRQTALERQLPKALVETYLTRHIRFRLQEEERRGLKRFLDEVARLPQLPSAQASVPELAAR